MCVYMCMHAHVCVYVWDSLGPSPALALSHITARVTVPYRTVLWTVSHVCLNWTTYMGA